ncbi:MAG: cold shock domain-containing protein [Bacteroidota bacterium]
MAKSQETWNKKEREKKKQKSKQDKQEKKLERKQNAGSEGKSLDDMMAYIDENGNISSTPPDPTKKRKVINAEDIEVGVPKQRPVDPADLIRKGTVSFFNESKGYGFIQDLQSQERVFVHVNGLTEAIKENNKVTFEVEMGPKGPSAVNVKLAQ